MTLRQLETALDDDAQVVGLIGMSGAFPRRATFARRRSGDILIIEAEPEALAATLSRLDLKLEEDVRTSGADAEDVRQRADQSTVRAIDNSKHCNRTTSS